MEQPPQTRTVRLFPGRLTEPERAWLLAQLKPAGWEKVEEVIARTRALYSDPQVEVGTMTSGRFWAYAGGLGELLTDNKSPLHPGSIYQGPTLGAALDRLLRVLGQSSWPSGSRR